MYYQFFRYFPKNAFSRLMGWLADIRGPHWLLLPIIRLYIAAFRIDMRPFEGAIGSFPTFNAFFTRPLKPGARPLPMDPGAVVCPVDATVIECGPIRNGQLVQVKGHTFSLRALLNNDPDWRQYDGGWFLSAYLSPKDYHRIHSPISGEVRRFSYVPGALWTVSPAGVRGVPNLFAVNERWISWIEAPWGQVALVKVGATVVGRIRTVYHSLVSHRRGARPVAETLPTPFAVERGAELARFELGSTILLLGRPREVHWVDLQPGEPLRMGQVVGTVVGSVMGTVNGRADGTAVGTGVGAAPTNELGKPKGGTPTEGLEA